MIFLYTDFFLTCGVQKFFVDYQCYQKCQKSNLSIGHIYSDYKTILSISDILDREHNSITKPSILGVEHSKYLTEMIKRNYHIPVLFYVCRYGHCIMEESLFEKVPYAHMQKIAIAEKHFYLGEASLLQPLVCKANHS